MSWYCATRRFVVTVIVVSVCATLVQAAVLEGNLTAPAPPTDPTSAMYTLDDIYNRLATGAPGSTRTGAFVEPLNAPAPTGPTLNHIMGAAPSTDPAAGATSDMVLSGKVYWGLTLGQWGTRAGNMAVRSLSEHTADVSAGYYNATTLTAVDADLIGNYIQNGITIFGVEGTIPPAAVARTGVTWSYHTYGDGARSPGVAWPVPRFSLGAGNLTVTDNLTGLMWTRSLPYGSSTYNWSDALDNAETSVSVGGYTDWRVPTRFEILSLVDHSQYNPSLMSGHPFNVSVGNFWSSTHYTPDAFNRAWMLNLVDGASASEYKFTSGLVWPVRNAP